jgi:SAM-dependent methyltransferase
MQDYGWSVRGIDFDANAAASARRKGLEVDVGDLRQQAYSQNAFDAITMSHVIEHVYDPRSLLHECYRVLRPGGSLVMVTPNPASLGHRWFSRNWRGLETPRHLYIYPPRTLASMVAGCGFSALHWRTSIRGAHWCFSDSLRMRRQEKGFGEPLVSDSIMSKALQVLEWLILPFDAVAGEETVLIATKAPVA